MMITLQVASMVMMLTMPRSTLSNDTCVDTRLRVQEVPSVLINNVDHITMITHWEPNIVGNWVHSRSSWSSEDKREKGINIKFMVLLHNDMLDNKNICHRLSHDSIYSRVYTLELWLNRHIIPTNYDYQRCYFHFQ